jgi:hypothetical protein
MNHPERDAATSPSAADFVAPRDVLLRDTVFPHSLAVTVLGIPTQLRTNDRRVLAMFQSAFGSGVEDPGADPAGAALRLSVQVVVHPGNVESIESRAVRHICPDHARVLMHGSGGIAISDPLRHEALVYASDGLVRDEAHFRQCYLEAVVLALVTHFDRQPLHAAAVHRHGRAVLLMGPSGAGKSTLAYAAHAAGLDVLSEDIVWVQMSPVTRVWGKSQAIHLLAGAGVLFPELEHMQTSVQPNGKHKMTVPIEPRAKEGSAGADRVVVCLLERGRGCAQLSRVEPDELHFALMQDAAAGFDRYPERRAECAHLLSANGGWRLNLSVDPHDGLSLIDDLLRRDD